MYIHNCTLVHCTCVSVVGMYCMQACNLVEQTVEFLDETRKKERVRGGGRHSNLVYLVTISPQIKTGWVLGVDMCTQRTVTCTLLHLSLNMYMHVSILVHVSVWTRAPLCLSTDTGVYSQYAGGRESSHFHWKENYVSSCVTMHLQCTK